MHRDRSPRPPRILVIEDEAFIRELVMTRLSIAGYDVFGARDGQQGLQKILELRPTALILDITMPGMDGFQVLEHLKRTGALDRTPTLMLTARNQADDVKKAIALGAKDFLSKPFDDSRLLARTARLCGLARQPVR